MNVVLGYSLRQAQVLKCGLCKQGSLGGEKENVAEAVLFGARRYHICPCCFTPVSNHRAKNWAWQLKFERYVSRSA